VPFCNLWIVMGPAVSDRLPKSESPVLYQPPFTGPISYRPSGTTSADCLFMH